MTIEEDGAQDRQSDEYQARVDQELTRHSKKEIVHDLPAIANYWAGKFLVPMAQEFGYSSVNEFYYDYVRRVNASVENGSTLYLASIGAGNCDTEVLLAKTLIASGVDNFFLECVELNPDMLARGRNLAAREQLADKIGFSCVDINSWQPASSCHVIIANQSLHHFQNLEFLFGRINETLLPEGYFLTHDMIGRNGHQRWPEALAIVESLWDEMPDKYKFNHQWQQVDEKFINRDCAIKSFEGIRAQDILPLLIENFKFDFFLAYANVIDVFIDRGYGPNFDVSDTQDCAFIDRVQALDQHAIESGRIKATHITAAMRSPDQGSRQLSACRYYKHLTPEFCLRKPER